VTLLLLDEGVLSLVTNPRASDKARRCTEWLEAVLARLDRVLVPAIADDELRRELLRANKLAGLSRLDDLAERLGVWR
jgi:predicted nucleic acid-binding protein